MGKIEKIVIHCSNSKFGCVAVIRKWHTDPKPKGNGWKDIGYHYVILNGYPFMSTDFVKDFDGTIEQGRYQDGDDYLNGDEIGAHAYGMNSKSLGICLIGEKREDFTDKQLQKLIEKVHFLMDKHDINIDNVIGHYESEYANGKTCPNIDMDWMREQILGYGIGA